MVKDELGNPLEVGQMVQIKLPAQTAYGRVVEVREGGMAEVGGVRKQPGKGDQVQVHMTPAMVKVQLTYDFMADPEKPFMSGCTRVHDPEGKDAQIAGKAKKSGLII